MDANDRRVDHSNVPVVGFCDRVHQAVPHAGLPPAIEAIVDGRWRPITLWQVGPPSSRPQYPKNAVQYPAIIDPRHTARLIRQTRLDRLPLGIRQLIAAHRKPPVWELESRLARAGNPRTRFMSLRPRTAMFCRCCARGHWCPGNTASAFSGHIVRAWLQAQGLKARPNRTECPTA